MVFFMDKWFEKKRKIERKIAFKQQSGRLMAGQTLSLQKKMLNTQFINVQSSMKEHFMQHVQLDLALDIDY
jgi:hypothetical protein